MIWSYFRDKILKSGRDGTTDNRWQTTDDAGQTWRLKYLCRFSTRHVSISLFADRKTQLENRQKGMNVEVFIKGPFSLDPLNLNFSNYYCKQHKIGDHSRLMLNQWGVFFKSFVLPCDQSWWTIIHLFIKLDLVLCTIWWTYSIWKFS